jgi:hypothetical protein
MKHVRLSYLRGFIFEPETPRVRISNVAYSTARPFNDTNTMQFMSECRAFRMRFMRFRDHQEIYEELLVT